MTELVASARSAGRPYAEAVHWTLAGGPPPELAAHELVAPSPLRSDAEIVFSALEAAVAAEVEPAYRAAGRTVVSNAGAFRLDPEVPLVIPEVNPGHLTMVERQRARHGGAIVTNPNCSTIGLCLSLEPLRRSLGVRRMTVTTLQALSGAGHPGVSALDVIGNVLPGIPGEEEKLESEPHKVFGRLEGAGVASAPLVVSAQCNRVAVRDGHLLSVAVELEREPANDEAREAVVNYVSPLSGLGLPSAPERPVVLVEEPGGPQPLRDRDAGGGMTVTVGRLRSCPVLGVRYVALVHNTVRGAAGGAVLIAELLVATGLA